jgi:hypothetical protein
VPENKSGWPEVDFVLTEICPTTCSDVTMPPHGDCRSHPVPPVLGRFSCLGPSVHKKRLFFPPESHLWQMIFVRGGSPYTETTFVRSFLSFNICSANTTSRVHPFCPVLFCSTTKAATSSPLPYFLCLFTHHVGKCGRKIDERWGTEIIWFNRYICFRSQTSSRI